jgi:hypothetical protein
MRKGVLAALAVMTVLVAATPSVEAHGRRPVRTHVFIGAGWPIWWHPYPYWYPWAHYPSYYYPRVVIREEPPVYIQQPPPPATPQAAPESYWYYCSSADGYYPTVKECPEPWVKVPPRPQ